MASLVLVLPASLGLSAPSSRGSTRRLPSTLLCRARLRSNDDSLHSGPSSTDWVAKPGDAPSPNAQHPSPSNGSPSALFAKLGSRSALYGDCEDYVLIEPGQDEEFVNLEELRARLKKWLENWPDNKLPRDLIRYDNLDEAVTFLLDSACELEIADGSGTIQWFEVRLE